MGLDDHGVLLVVKVGPSPRRARIEARQRQIGSRQSRHLVCCPGMGILVDVRLVPLTLRHRWAISRAALTEKQVAIVRLRWNGFDGWGEAAPISRYGEAVEDVPAAVERLAPPLGADPRAYR